MNVNRASCAFFATLGVIALAAIDVDSPAIALIAFFGSMATAAVFLVLDANKTADRQIEAGRELARQRFRAELARHSEANR